MGRLDLAVMAHIQVASSISFMNRSIRSVSKTENGSTAEDSRCAHRMLKLLSMMCACHGRGLLCEPPEVRSIEYYLTNDVPLAAFLVAAGPAPGRRCVQSACGDGASAHLQTFLHGRGRITLSVSRLPEGQELPGDDKGQIWVWARPLKVGAENE